MPETTTRSEADLVATLNDMLMLDHDAVQAYSLAINRLSSELYKQTLTTYRGDHERHIRELTELIRRYGGIPMELPHIPTGAFKLATQAVGAAGGDVGILLAFKSNERQGRDKYRRVANERHPEDVALVLQRAANDEATHYAWVLEVLEDQGVGANTTTGKAQAAFETAHTRMADATETVGRQGMRAAEHARRAVPDKVKRHPVATALGAGAAVMAIAAATMLGRRK